MKKMFLDIETLPAGESSYPVLKYLYEERLRKRKKRKELPEGMVTEGGADDFEAFVRGTSFDGGFGRILCAAYALDNEPVQVICHDGYEKETLKEFWRLAPSVGLFIGHNIMDFDLRFIYQRSIVLGVRPTREIIFARYRNNPIYDTLREWTKWAYGNNIGLEHLALALGLPTPKEGIDGSQVYDFYQAGKVEEICEYCKRDVDTTREIYKRMNFLA